MDGMWRLGRGLALGLRPVDCREPRESTVALANLTKQIQRDRSQEEKIARTLLKISERIAGR